MGQLNYREVTGFFTARIPDSGDADLNPDTVPLTGNVTFHPEYRKPLVFPGEHIVLEPINAIIIDGQLMVEVIQNEDVVLQALHLPVTMDERANQTWSWTMRFHGMTLGQYGEEVALPERRFPVEGGDGPLDLSDVAGQWSGGTLITKGPRGYGVTNITAENGVVTVEWEGGDDVEVPIPTAALATPSSNGLMPKGDKAKLDGITVSTSVGRRVNIGGETVFYDSGWRSLDLPDRFTSGRVLIRRTLTQATLRLEQVEISGLDNNPSHQFMTDSGYIPVGFRPREYDDRPAGVFVGNYTQYSSFLGISQQSRILYVASLGLPVGGGNARASGEISWTPAAALPSSLPGVPA